MNPNSLRTKRAYIATRLLDTPFWGLYNMLPVILYKDLHITPIEIGFLVALKPLVSLISGYWSSRIEGRVENLMPNIIWGRLIGLVPFLFFPWAQLSGFFILSYAVFMMMAVGVVPAWMEVLKISLPDRSREKVFSYTQAFGYMGGGLLPFLLGGVLDSSPSAWRWLFPILAGFASLSFFFQRKIRLTSQETISEPSSSSLKELLKKPWKESFHILKEDSSFRRFQEIFMLFGGGLMLLQPALPIFFVDVLNLSYTEIAVALTLCKGCGFALFSPHYAKKISLGSPFLLLSSVTLLSAIYPLLLSLAIWHSGWLYVSYFLYGIVQSGSELLWNLSGPYFSKDRSSTSYTNLNIVAVGIRGSFIPALGSALCISLGVFPVIFFNSALSFSAFLLTHIKLNSSKNPQLDIN